MVSISLVMVNGFGSPTNAVSTRAMTRTMHLPRYIYFRRNRYRNDHVRNTHPSGQRAAELSSGFHMCLCHYPVVNLFLASGYLYSPMLSWPSRPRAQPSCLEFIELDTTSIMTTVFATRRKPHCSVRHRRPTYLGTDSGNADSELGSHSQDS